MAEPVPLSFKRHGKLFLREPEDFSRFQSQHLVPVVFQEFYGLATEFPLVFVRHSESGEFIPVAMMGLTKGRNVYCHSSQWSPLFMPAGFTLAPLSLARVDPDSEEAAVCIDEGSSLLSESVGEPLFDDHGEYTAYLRKRIDRLTTITKQTLQARILCQLLADKQLLRTRPLNLQLSATSPRYEVEGVYMIDEEALEGLGDQEFLELRQRGLLPLIYSHLTSLQQFGRLLRVQSLADQKEV